MVTLADATPKATVHVSPGSAEGSSRPAHDAAMDALWKAHATALYWFLCRLTCGDRRLAEELVQETLLRAWRFLQVDSVDMETIRPWLYTVARRLAIDAGRAQRARPVEVTTVDVTGIAKPHDEIDRLLMACAMQGWMKELSEDHRAILIEVYYRDRTIKEAAAVLGIPEGTAKSRTYYALRALRAAIGPGFEAD